MAKPRGKGWSKRKRSSQNARPSKQHKFQLPQLPSEVLEKIFLQLDPRDVVSCQLVCKQWAATLSDDLVWKRLLSAHYSLPEDFPWHKDQPKTPKFSSWREDYMAFTEFEHSKSCEVLIEKEDKLEVACVGFSNSGRYLAACVSGLVMIWDVEDNFTPTGRTSLRGVDMRSLSFNETDEKILITGDDIAPFASGIGSDHPQTFVFLSFPELKKLHRLETPDDREVASYSWFGLNSILVGESLRSHDQSVIYSAEPGHEPNILDETHTFHKIHTVDDTTQGRKRLILWHHGTSLNGDPNYLKSIEINGSKHDPLHSCDRCKNSPNSCVLADYSTADVSVFQLQINEEDRYAGRSNYEWLLNEVATKFDNKIVTVIVVRGECIVLTVYDTEISDMSPIDYIRVFGLIHGREPFWTKVYDNNLLLTDNNVEGDCFAPPVYEETPIGVYIHHYGIWLYKKTEQSGLKELNEIQPKQGKWLVTGGKGQLKCWKMNV